MDGIKEMTERINELETELEELRNDFDWYQTQADEAQEDIDDKENEIRNLNKQINEVLFFSKTASPADYIEYIISNTTGKELQGQYLINGRWTICDGIVLVDSEKEFEAPHAEGLPNISYEEKMPPDRKSIEIDFDTVERREIENGKVVVKVGAAWVQLKLIQLVLGIVGKPMCVYHGGRFDAVTMECENGRALVLPMRVEDEV